MTRTSLKSMFAAAILMAAPLAAQDPAPVNPQAAEAQQLFTVEELDNLLAPVALYPDPILVQVLVAATFPDQIALAARYVRTYGQQGIDNQAWDVSVKSVAHYPPVLNLLDERPDWTTALGQAYALQEGDVMASVQGLRKMAQAQGNLVSTNEQRVENEGEAIRILPASPRVIYVPTYDPYVVYYQPIYYHQVYSPYWSFSVGFPIGVWLTYDFDWGHRVVYYHGWNGYGYGHSWYHDSRPFISFNSIYINQRSVVYVNRNVIYRHVRYDRFHEYNWVHRRVAWDRRGLPGRYDGNGDNDRGRGVYPRRDVAGNQPRQQPTGSQEPRTARPRGTATPTGYRRDVTRYNPPSPSRDISRNNPVEPTREVTRTSPRDNGTWNARPTADARKVTAPRTTTAPRQATPTREYSRPAAPRGYSAPRQSSAPRQVTVDRGPRQSAPQAAPRNTQRSAPSAAPRQSRGERSAPAKASSSSNGRSGRSKH